MNFHLLIYLYLSFTFLYSFNETLKCSNNTFSVIFEEDKLCLLELAIVRWFSREVSA